MVAIPSKTMRADVKDPDSTIFQQSMRQVPWLDGLQELKDLRSDLLGKSPDAGNQETPPALANLGV